MILLVNAYTGGQVDVYQCSMEEGYYYDVNSLYPFSMCKEMPVGSPIYFNQVSDLDNFFGFINIILFIL